MARIFPFQPYRYSEKAGPLDRLVTQPYDKISPEMRARYLSLSPYNLVRVILGERFPDDNERENVYTRAARHFDEWIARGVLARDAEPAIYPYFQEFTVPDTGERLVRKGFIALGALEDYSAGIVHRHEQTLSGPKKDRLELLRHTRAHFGQLFMLYPDPEGAIDALLDRAAAGAPLAGVTDEYGAGHRLWRIPGGDEIRRLMADKKLLIADGHHRYETALAFRDESGADKVMMTFVNMHSPGLKILATHRLVSGLAEFDPRAFLGRAAGEFDVREAAASGLGPGAIGAAIGDRIYLLSHRTGELDVRVLHQRILAGMLGIGEEAVRDERHLRYIRGLEAAVQAARTGQAQIAFLLHPTSIDDVARISFGGGVMPQKSTDFYPKLLSGLAIYKI
ncbi:MAG: DUF1015 domain-containing protein [Bryobacteraceae bacterium]